MDESKQPISFYSNVYISVNPKSDIKLPKVTKNGDKLDIENYRLISALPHPYKNADKDLPTD